jgi:hypothetical protein
MSQEWLANTAAPLPGGTHWVQQRNLTAPKGPWQFLRVPSLSQPWTGLSRAVGGAKGGYKRG